MKTRITIADMDRLYDLAKDVGCAIQTQFTNIYLWVPDPRALGGEKSIQFENWDDLKAELLRRKGLQNKTE